LSSGQVGLWRIDPGRVDPGRVDVWASVVRDVQDGVVRRHVEPLLVKAEADAAAEHQAANDREQTARQHHNIQSITLTITSC
jgi:hypothetical protein